jgi:predicted alpha/beta-hydrolase family hydrolase
VAGRRAPDRADRLDAAMLAVVATLRAELPGVPLIVGGKSSGARVGCRTARALGAAGVLALGFPLTPPGRPDRSRAAELDAGCPVLVLQGSRDSFGTPADVRLAAKRLPVEVHEVAGGDHSYAARRGDERTTADCIAEVAAVAAAWVQRLA